MTGQHLDLLARLEQDLTDRSAALADLLRICIVLGGRTQSTRLSEWATYELKGYPDRASVPGYRVVTAPILQEIYYSSTQGTEKEILKSHDYSLILDDPVDKLDATASYCEARGRPFLIPVDDDVLQQQRQKEREQRNSIFREPGSSVGYGGGTESMEWVIDSPLILSILGQIRTSLTEFIVELRGEVGNSDELPSASQTDKAFRVALPTAVFSNSNVTIMTTGRGNISSDDDRTIIRDNKTTIKGSSGAISVAGAKISRTNNEIVDAGKVRHFADLVYQISPTLDLVSKYQTELQAVADDLIRETDSSVPEPGRLRRLLGSALKLLRAAGPSAAGKLAIAMGDELIQELGQAVIREFPH